MKTTKSIHGHKHVATTASYSPGLHNTTEAEAIFSALDSMIAKAEETGQKDLYSLMRDKIILSLLFFCGMRLKEILSLTIHSFEQVSFIPASGYYGFITVCKKGNLGSEDKVRKIPLTHDELPAMIDQYIHEIQPKFFNKSRYDEKALFLTDKGAVLSYVVQNYRFHAIMLKAGLDNKNFTLQSLRRAGLFEMSSHMSYYDMCKITGHRPRYSSTTVIP